MGFKDKVSVSLSLHQWLVALYGRYSPTADSSLAHPQERLILRTRADPALLQDGNDLIPWVDEPEKAFDHWAKSTKVRIVSRVELEKAKLILLAIAQGRPVDYTGLSHASTFTDYTLEYPNLTRSRRAHRRQRRPMALQRAQPERHGAPVHRLQVPDDA